MVGLLANRKFVLYNAKVSFSSFGYTLYLITIPAYSYIFSGSIIFTGITLFIEYGIYTLTFLIGPIVDRVVDKRFVIVGSEGAISVIALIFGILIHMNALNHATFLIIVAAIAICDDLIWAADWTVLPMIVDDTDLARAKGYTIAVGDSQVAAGLGIGGFLFIVLGPYASMILYAACMFVSVFLAAYIPVKVSREGRRHQEGLLAGWHYVFVDNRLRLWLSFVLAFFAFFATAPALGVTDLFSISSRPLYAVMYSLYFVGSIVAGIVFGRIYGHLNLPRTMALCFVVSGILFILTSLFSGNPWLDAPAWFALGMFFSAYLTLYGAYLQLSTAKEMLGRTASNLYTFRGISTAAGTLLIPFLIQSYGVRFTLTWAGIAVLIGGLIFLFMAQSFTTGAHNRGRINS